MWFPKFSTCWIWSHCAFFRKIENFSSKIHKIFGFQEFWAQKFAKIGIFGRKNLKNLEFWAFLVHFWSIFVHFWSIFVNFGRKNLKIKNFEGKNFKKIKNFWRKNLKNLEFLAFFVNFAQFWSIFGHFLSIFVNFSSKSSSWTI